MAGGIQPVESNPRSDYGGGSVGLLSKSKDRKKGSGGKGSDAAADPPVLKRGGKVRKTGMALVHKGERMLTAKQDNKRKSKGRRKGRSKSR